MELNRKYQQQQKSVDFYQNQTSNAQTEGINRAYSTTERTQV